MTAPIKQDAAFRYTENGQERIHYLGAKLRRPSSNGAQHISSFESADLTTIRRVSVSMGVRDLRATIRYDGQPQQLADFLAAAKRTASLEYVPSLSQPGFSIGCWLMDAGPIVTDRQLWWHPRYEVEVHLRARIGTWEGVVAPQSFEAYEDSEGFYILGQDQDGQAYGLSTDADDFYITTPIASASRSFERVRPVEVVS